MTDRILELALEALEAKKAAVEREIAQLRGSAAGETRQSGGNDQRRKRRTAAQKKAQSERMRQYWAKRKAQSAQAPKRRGRARAATA